MTKTEEFEVSKKNIVSRNILPYNYSPSVFLKRLFGRFIGPSFYNSLEEATEFVESFKDSKKWKHLGTKIRNDERISTFKYNMSDEKDEYMEWGEHDLSSSSNHYLQLRIRPTKQG